MKIFSKLLVLGAVLAASTSFAYADTLGPGSVSFYGLNTLTSSSLTFTGTQYDPLASGSLSSFANGTDFFLNLTSFTTMPTNPLFAIISGSEKLNYYLTSLSYSAPGPDSQTLTGTGYFTVTAVSNPNILIDTATDGSFHLTTQDGLTTFSADSAITSAPTPEPGSLLLLGTGLLSAAGIARRKFASKLV